MGWFDYSHLEIKDLKYLFYPWAAITLRLVLTSIVSFKDCAWLKENRETKNFSQKDKNRL